ncbi:MAG: maltose alpha-D-glucosyltransferase [Deltaproteobacteria bacterium]|nr:maltose alpha-D-glucosyltransferase [Deltaproteobacteria bacterium]
MDSQWHKDAIIYQLHVRGFYDSSGDGIGDFRGLTEKLEYIKDLGATAIWLLPMYPSPLKDDGYDIADYYGINPDFGTIDDFRTFLDRAHTLGLRVLTELVVNHTSDQHKWFQEARKSRESPYRDWYVWADTDEKYKEARIIFTDTEKSNWTFDPVAGQFFWHRFFSHQPDLNYDNPEVVKAVLDVMSYWLDMGVDGFRVDAVPYLIEREGTNCENLPETHAILKELRRKIDKAYKGRILLGEANQWPVDVRPYFGEPDKGEPEFHMAFHFPLMPRMFMALRREERKPIAEILGQTPPIPEECQWGIFLRNHDELTLEMVTDEERDYMYKMYARDPRMRVNVGIRRRLAPLMDNDRRQIELLKAMLMSMPGTPIIYYGDEIGMGDNIYLGDRNGVRTPMQWSPDRNAGFSKADPQRLYFPVNQDPVYGFMAVNVEAQQRSPYSLLNFMKRLIDVRKKYPVFGRGTMELLHPTNKAVFAYVREWERRHVLCVNNLSSRAQMVELDLIRFAGVTPVEMLGEEPFREVSSEPYVLTLPPYGFLWLRLEPPRGTIAPPEEPLPLTER